jgi:phosphatidylserine synthase
VYAPGAYSSQGGLGHPSARGTEDLPSSSQDATVFQGPRTVNTTMSTNLGTPRVTTAAMCQPSAHSFKDSWTSAPGPLLAMGLLLCSLSDFENISFCQNKKQKTKSVLNESLVVVVLVVCVFVCVYVCVYVCVCMFLLGRSRGK